MKKTEAGIFISVLVFIFLLVYSPHFTYPYPLHIDEWHHIEQAIKLKEGRILYGESGLEIGFRFFLMILSFFCDLVLIYKFLPAIWAVFSALALFYFIRKKTQEIPESFFISIMAVIFFGFIKSNVNLLGLWFFTPLTFSIPFVFLYIYFFTEGIEKENKKMVLLSMLIMIFVLISHAPSLLFSIPVLIIYCLFNIEKTKKQYKTLLYFLIIPLIAIIFYKLIVRISFKELIVKAFSLLQFKYGWGVVELNNSPFEIYSLIGYILAFLGLIFIFYTEEIKKYLIFILWPAVVLLSIFIFRITNISFFSPYQRNFYYFAMSLPILSSFGIYFMVLLIKNKLDKIGVQNRKILYLIMKLMVIFFIVFLMFVSYFNIPTKLGLYKLVSKEDYEAIKFLSNFNVSKVIAPIEISTALYPISHQEPIATIHFIGNATEAEYFYDIYDCDEKNEIAKKYNASYVFSKTSLNCNWTIIYSKEKRFIYKTS